MQQLLLITWLACFVLSRCGESWPGPLYKPVTNGELNLETHNTWFPINDSFRHVLRKFSCKVAELNFYTSMMERHTHNRVLLQVTVPSSKVTVTPSLHITLPALLPLLIARCTLAAVVVERVLVCSRPRPLLDSKVWC